MIKLKTVDYSLFTPKKQVIINVLIVFSQQLTVTN